MAILCKLKEIQAKTTAVHFSLLTSEPVSEALRLMSTGLVLSNCKWMAVKRKENTI